MSEETPPKRGEAAWKEQRDAISRRNQEAHQRSAGARKDRASYAASAARADAQRETEQLQKLNERIAKQQSR